MTTKKIIKKTTKKKSFKELKELLSSTATALLEFRYGKYDSENKLYELDDAEVAALTAAVAATADADALLEDLGKRVEKELKELKNVDHDNRDYKAIFLDRSVLGLWRWIENNIDGADDTFDIVEKKNGARCEIDNWLKDIINNL